uniref:Helitron_like_N domain-containing protein n=1 Tax=Panagrellus redivivus TaxID=6233 RepID=A0A7E4UP91_PANRE
MAMNPNHFLQNPNFFGQQPDENNNNGNQANNERRHGELIDILHAPYLLNFLEVNDLDPAVLHRGEQPRRRSFNGTESSYDSDGDDSVFEADVDRRAVAMPLDDEAIRQRVEAQRQEREQFPTRTALRVFGRAYSECRSNWFPWDNSRALCPFENRMHRTELQVHGDSLAYAKYLVPPYEDDPYERMKNFLIFQSFFLGNLSQLTCLRKPLRSFVGETFDINLNSNEERIQAIFEQVETNCVAMHIRGNGFHLEQHIRPNGLGTGYTGGGVCKFPGFTDEIGYTFDVTLTRSPDGELYLDRVLGQLKATSLADGGITGSIKSPRVPQATDVLAAVYNREQYSPFSMTSNHLGDELRVFEDNGDTRERRLIETVAPRSARTLKKFAKLLNKRHGKQVAQSDSRYRQDLRLVKRGNFRDAAAAYTSLCQYYSSEEELQDRFPKTQYFRRFCRNNIVYYVLRVGRDGGDPLQHYFRP